MLNPLLLPQPLRLRSELLPAQGQLSRDSEARLGALDLGLVRPHLQQRQRQQLPSLQVQLIFQLHVLNDTTWLLLHSENLDPLIMLAKLTSQLCLINGTRISLCVLGFVKT